MLRKLVSSFWWTYNSDDVIITDRTDSAEQVPTPVFSINNQLTNEPSKTANKSTDEAQPQKDATLVSAKATSPPADRSKKIETLEETSPARQHLHFSLRRSVSEQNLNSQSLNKSYKQKQSEFSVQSNDLSAEPLSGQWKYPQKPQSSWTLHSITSCNNLSSARRPCLASLTPLTQFRQRPRVVPNPHRPQIRAAFGASGALPSAPTEDAVPPINSRQLSYTDLSTFDTITAQQSQTTFQVIHPFSACRNKLLEAVVGNNNSQQQTYHQNPHGFYDPQNVSLYARSSNLPSIGFIDYHLYQQQQQQNLPSNQFDPLNRHRGELALHEKYRYDLSKSQLKASSRTSALLAGFAMVALVELQYDEHTPHWLLILLGVVTTLLVSVHLLSLMISTCLLPYIEATGCTQDSPHIQLSSYIELSWIFSTCIGLILFLLEIVIIFVIKFNAIKFDLGGYITTIMLAPVLIVFAIISWLIHRQRFSHSVERVNNKVVDLEKFIDENELHTHKTEAKNSQQQHQPKVIQNV